VTVSHTRRGWDNGVEPGIYMQERKPSVKSLLALKALSERHPNVIVRPGHQEEAAQPTRPTATDAEPPMS
jgi:N-acyl homoserine lactone hydrolase